MPRNSESFLPEKYKDLPGSPEVESAVRKSLREGKGGPQTKGERIERYLDRLENLVQDERGFEHLKYQILQKS